MKSNRIPRPGDVIRLTNDHWRKKGAEFVVIEGHYTSGPPSFSTHSFAWVQMKDLAYVRRATDKEFFAALRKSEGLE